MVIAPPKPQGDTSKEALPRVTSRSKRAWRLLRRAKPFVLVHQGVTYYVDRGGWANVTEGPRTLPVRASKLLDPAKKELSPHRRQ